MTDSKALVIQSGVTRQIPDSDNLVFDGFAPSSGTDVTLTSGSGLASAGGAGSFDWSGASGTFKTSTGTTTVAGVTTFTAAGTALTVDNNATVSGNMTVAGNLTVNGTTTTTDSETVLIADNHLYLNSGYTADAAQTGGLIVNVDPDATATEAVAAGGFTAGVASTSNPTIEVAATTGFAAGDFVQVSGSTSNDGLYEVQGLLTTPNRLDIRGIGLNAEVHTLISQNQLTTEAGAGQVDKVKISVMRTKSDGVWETGTGATTTDLTNSFADVATSTGQTLQAAYDAGQTITTDATGGTLTINGDQQLALGGTLTMDYGSSGAVTATGNPTWDFGTGQADFGGNLDANAGLDVTGGNFTHASGGTGNVDVAWDFSGGVTNSAGELLVSGGNMQLNDSIVMSWGTGDDQTMSSDGTDWTMDNTVATGSTIFKLGTDTSATDFQVQNNSGVAKLTVDGAGNLSHTGGTVTMRVTDNTTNAVLIQEGANAYLDMNTTNGSEEITLHQHTKIIDDKSLRFGTNTDWTVTYDEATDDALEILGTASAAKVAGTTFTIAGSAGGIAADSAAAGAGGDLTWTAGAGGAGTATASEVGGAGGNVTLAAGAGGAGSGAIADGSGGNLTLQAGAAGGGGAATGVHGKIVIEDASMFELPAMTTAARDAFSAVNGMIIYNSTTAQFEGYDNAWSALGSGGSVAGTDNLSFTINQDGGTTNENAALVLESGDGTSEFQGFWTLDADQDPPILEYSVTDDGAADTPQVAIGAGGETADLDATLFFNSGTGGAAQQASILFDGTNDDLEIGSGATAVSAVVNLDAEAGLDVSGGALTVANQAITQTTGGQVTFAGNVDADAGLDVSGAALTIANQAITQTTGGQVTFAGNVDADAGLDVTGALTQTGGTVSMAVTDNSASALLLEDGAGDDYLLLATTTGSEKMSLGNAATNPDYEFLGSGLVDLANGTADVPAGTSLSLGGVACTAGVTAANLNTLTDGSNADSLHTHAAINAGFSATSGEILSAGMLVTMDNDGGNARGFKADSTASNDRQNIVGVADSAVADETAFKVIQMGEVSVADALWDSVPAVGDVGKEVYSSVTTAGEWTLTAPATSGQTVTRCGWVSVGGTGAVKVAVNIGTSVLL